MENHHHHHHHVAETIVFLSMNISCCDRCPKILNKKLLKMPGVKSVSIDMENDVVQVTGSLDPMALLNNVAKLGKRVHLLPNEGPRHRPTNKQKPKFDSPCDGGGGGGGGGPREHMKNPEKKEEEPHRCEPYEAANISEKVCRDFFCKVHPRGRSIVDKVKAKEGSSFLFGGMPPYCGGGFGPYSGGSNSYMNPMWNGVEPPMYDYHQQQQGQFGQFGQQPQYGWQRSRMLPPRTGPFGYE